MESVSICSACGQQLPSQSGELQVGGYKRRHLVELLLQHRQGMSRLALLHELYADEESLPNLNIISVFVSKLNVELSPQGWVIRSASAHPHRYVLERLPA